LDFSEICTTFTVPFDLISFARRSQIIADVKENCQLVVHRAPAFFCIDGRNIVLASELVMSEEALVPGVVKTLEWTALPAGGFPFPLDVPGVCSLVLDIIKL
jgi:hypothetical protein